MIQLHLHDNLDCEVYIPFLRVDYVCLFYTVSVIEIGSDKMLYVMLVSIKRVS